MDNVCDYIESNSNNHYRNFITFNQTDYDDECYIGGIYSITSHIAQTVLKKLKNVYDINTINYLNIPIVTFKYKNKNIYIIEIKFDNGQYKWLLYI